MRYRLTFCEADTGILLNQDGSRSLNGQRWQPIFDSEEKAIELKDSLLEQFAIGECMIENLETKESARYSDQARVDQYMTERQKYFEYQSLSWIKKRATKEPELQLYKPNQHVDFTVETPVD